MVTVVYDERVWAEYWLDMPISPPGGKSAADALVRPGNAVKTLDLNTQLFGKLAKYDTSTQQAVVIGHSTTMPHLRNLVWTGSIDEYHILWEVD